MGSPKGEKRCCLKSQPHAQDAAYVDRALQFVERRVVRHLKGWRDLEMVGQLQPVEHLASHLGIRVGFNGCTVACRDPEKVTFPLEKVLADIAQDSQRRPEDYLDQVRVPFGGE